MRSTSSNSHRPLDAPSGGSRRAHGSVGDAVERVRHDRDTTREGTAQQALRRDVIGVAGAYFPFGVRMQDQIDAQVVFSAGRLPRVVVRCVADAAEEDREAALQRLDDARPFVAEVFDPRQAQPT